LIPSFLKKLAIEVGKGKKIHITKQNLTELQLFFPWSNFDRLDGSEPRLRKLETTRLARLVLKNYRLKALSDDCKDQLRLSRNTIGKATLIRAYHLNSIRSFFSDSLCQIDITGYPVINWHQVIEQLFKNL